MRSALLIELGSVDYFPALNLQRELHRLRHNETVPDTLILLEHPPVITLGHRAKKTNLLVSQEELAHRGIKVYQIERGGDITYHGPGQLIGYPIFRLKVGLLGIRQFVENIELALVSALKELGVNVQIKPKLIGVWVGDKKIASIGVAVREHITFHGFALNVRGDLSGFQLINPCGLNSAVMTSIEQQGGVTIPQTVRQAVVKGFERVFEIRFQRKLPRSLTSLTNWLNTRCISSASTRE
ncbi:MAG: lipoyl(octanoyl) transferase LipB [bacterium]